jgi:glycosyltransferase involved in cell wall biosynthesis
MEAMPANATSEIDYSIVVPVYFNEGELDEAMKSLKHDVIDRNPTLRGEVIFVDDGSGDNSFAELLRIRSTDPRTVKVIKLTRNFGQVSALKAGFTRARGKCVITMSADGQDPARLIDAMLDAYFREHYEIVVCTRQGRDESYYRILTSKLFYWIMRRLTFPQMPTGGFDFILMSRKVMQILLTNRDAHPFLQGQVLWTGFRTKFIEYQRRNRKVGISRWTFGKKLTYLIDGVMSYSFFPIRVISVMGMIVALLGFLYAFVILIVKLAWGVPILGWAPVMIVILLMGGFQMIMLGIIGEYVWRTLAQARDRDPYIIEATFEGDGLD